MDRSSRRGAQRNAPRLRIRLQNPSLRSGSVPPSRMRDVQQHKRDFNHDFDADDLCDHVQNPYIQRQFQTREFINKSYRDVNNQTARRQRSKNTARSDTDHRALSYNTRPVSSSHHTVFDDDARDHNMIRSAKNKSKRDRAKNRRDALAFNTDSNFTDDYVPFTDYDTFMERNYYTPERDYFIERDFHTRNNLTRDRGGDLSHPLRYRSLSLPNLGRINPSRARPFTRTPTMVSFWEPGENSGPGEVFSNKSADYRGGSRQTRYFPRTNKTRPRETPRNPNYTPAPPQLKTTIKLMYDLIRAVHHLDKVTTKKGNNQPITFQKLTDLLMTTIKPAFPNSRVTTLLEGNAKNWCFNAQLILEQHYEELVESTIQSLKDQTSQCDWPHAFEVATNWADRNFGQRMTTETIEQAKALFTAEFSEQQHSEAPAVNRTQHDAASSQHNAAPPPQRTYAQVVASPPGRGIPPPSSPLPQASVNVQFRTIDAQIQTSPSLRGDTLTAHPPPGGDWPVVVDDENLPLITFAPVRPTQAGQPRQGAETEGPTQAPQTSPLEQRKPRRSTRYPLAPGGVEPEPEEIDRPAGEGLVPTTSGRELIFPPLRGPGGEGRSSISTSPPHSSCAPLDREGSNVSSRCTSGNTVKTNHGSPVLSLHLLESDYPNDNTRVLSPLSRFLNEYEGPPTYTSGEPVCNPTVLEPGGTQCVSLPRPSQRAVPELGQTGSTDREFFASSPSSAGRPKRHANTTKKNSEWRLKINKKNLILGDSNVARLPRFQNTDLQVDAFPGAKFHHASNLIQKAQILELPEKIILSFGINNRQQRLRIRAIRELQTLIQTTRDRFPNAEIFVPVINFSRALPIAEQLMLEDINAYIQKHCDCIPSLPSSEKFEVERDGIHWRPSTAKSMLEHWAMFLNYPLASAEHQA